MSNKKPKQPPSHYRHEQADRVNQPTVETSPLMDQNTRAPKPFTLAPPPPPRVDRKSVPEPRLSWDRQGRTSSHDGPRDFAGTPLYTREKVNPLSLIDQLRKPDTGVAFNLFDDFNGLPAGAQKWEFYQHSGHWQNRLIHGDSSQVMQSLIARDGLGGQVQMIYFDPPYGIGFKSNFMSETGSTDANNIPVGDTAPIKAFKDTYTNGIHSYFDELHERFTLFHELLKPSGSLFVQIGDENVHRMAVLLDEVYGADNRVATITWRSTGFSSSQTLPETASYLLWYAKDKSQIKYRSLHEPLDRAGKIKLMSSYARVEFIDGSNRRLEVEERVNPDGLLPEGARIYQMMPLTSSGASTTGRTCDYLYNGVIYHCGATRQWSVWRAWPRPGAHIRP